MRQRGGTLRLYQLSMSTESTQKNWRSPRSIRSPTHESIPRPSISKKRPPDVGKTRTGSPACPNTSISISRPRRVEYHLWYSRFIRLDLLLRLDVRSGLADTVTGKTQWPAKIDNLSGNGAHSHWMGNRTTIRTPAWPHPRRLKTFR